MSLLPKSIHRCRRYPTKFNSGRDIPDRTCAALARYGTPRAWRALVDHGLNTESRLGSTVTRLIAAGHQDLSNEKELLKRLVDALKAELPRSLLGMKINKNDEKRLSLVQALAGTPAREVRELFQEIVDRYPGEKFAEAATKALATFTTRGETAPAGLSGDLDLFGLPTVLQMLAHICNSSPWPVVTSVSECSIVSSLERSAKRWKRGQHFVGEHVKKIVAAQVEGGVTRGNNVAKRCCI